MLNQRDIDIAQLEAKMQIERIFQEWVQDYLGGRYAITGYEGESTEDAGDEETYAGEGIA